MEAPFLSELSLSFVRPADTGREMSRFRCVRAEVRPRQRNLRSAIDYARTIETISTL
jgi:hypothetical protein